MYIELLKCVPEDLLPALIADGETIVNEVCYTQGDLTSLLDELIDEPSEDLKKYNLSNEEVDSIIEHIMNTFNRAHSWVCLEDDLRKNLRLQIHLTGANRPDTEENYNPLDDIDDDEDSDDDLWSEYDESDSDPW